MNRVKIPSADTMGRLRRKLLSGQLTNDDFNVRSIKKREIQDIKQIIIHCSDSPNPDVTIYDVNSWHKKRGWAGCGYHYFISSNGKVWGGRKESWVGSHCRDHNSNSIGICVNGRTNFTKFQEESLTNLLLNILLRLRFYELNNSKINNDYINSVIKKTTPYTIKSAIHAQIFAHIPIFAHNYYDHQKTCPNFIVPYFLLTGKIVPYVAKLL